MKPLQDDKLILPWKKAKFGLKFSFWRSCEKPDNGTGQPPGFEQLFLIRRNITFDNKALPDQSSFASNSSCRATYFKAFRTESFNPLKKINILFHPGDIISSSTSRPQRPGSRGSQGWVGRRRLRWRARLGLGGCLGPGSADCSEVVLVWAQPSPSHHGCATGEPSGGAGRAAEVSSGRTGSKTALKGREKYTGEAFRGAPVGRTNYRPKPEKVPVIFNLKPSAVCTQCPSSYQGVPLHVLPAGELLPADLAGVRSFSRVGSHVSLQDALMHGWKTAVRALELLPDDCELVDCKRASKTHRLLSEWLKTVSLLIYYFTISSLWNHTLMS